MLAVDLGNPLRMSNCGNNFGSKCNFSCAIGHRLNGSSTLTCVAPGNRPPGFWDNSTPVCQSGFGSIYVSGNCPPTPPLSEHFALSKRSREVSVNAD